MRRTYMALLCAILFSFAALVAALAQGSSTSPNTGSKETGCCLEIIGNYTQAYDYGSSAFGHVVAKIAGQDAELHAQEISYKDQSRILTATGNVRMVRDHQVTPKASPFDFKIDSYGYLVTKPNTRVTGPQFITRRVADNSSIDDDLTSSEKELPDDLFQCEGIYVGEYKGFKENDPITFSQPPKAKFRLVEYLKGPPFGTALPVHWAFSENIDELPPKDWAFNPSMMPKMDSKWFLFLPVCVAVDGALDTYRGPIGRLEYSQANAKKVMQGLRSSLKNESGP